MTLSQNSLNKIKTYVGFCIRSGKVIFGTDNMLLSKKVKIAIYDSSLSENALSKLRRHSEEWKYQLIEAEGLAEITHKDNCRVIGIKKGSLAEQISSIIAEDTKNN